MLKYWNIANQLDAFMNLYGRLPVTQIGSSI